jgi:tRNA(Ile)-lysidine synthase
LEFKERVLISDDALNLLRGGKNLLAFSGGVDSSALFHILLENSIEFDMAIVDYNLRKQSKEEIAYAKHLAKHFEKSIFIGSVAMDKFSEGTGREIRYNFFEQIIEGNEYKNLIMAHQLNDKLEWFLMQFSKGAGLLELTGMGEFEVRDGYKIVRPLIDISKERLLRYLDERDIRYFIDASNFDEKYKRNYFRHNFSNRFLEEFEEGVINSFRYLDDDRASILRGGSEIENREKLYFFKKSDNDRVDIFYIDKILKRNGYILSSKQREEILKDREVVVGGDWVIALTKERVYISPYIQIVMTKDFREKCRIQRVPNLIRPYIFKTFHGEC